MRTSTLNCPSDRRSRPGYPVSMCTRCAAFTLIELLIVMGIIVLLIALALPAFNLITGSRSVEAADNQLSAVLGIARAEAIGLQQPRGVAIWHDAITDRTTAGIVELRYGPFSAWDASASGTNAVSYAYGEYRSIGAGTKSVTYVCTEAYTDRTGKLTPANDADHWRELTSMDPAFDSTANNYDATPIVEFRTNTDYLTLAKGIDVRGIGNVARVPGVLKTTSTDYRYASVVVVMFDGFGAVMTLPNLTSVSSMTAYPPTAAVLSSFRVLNEGLLGTRANLPYLIARQPTQALGTADQALPVTTPRDLSPFVYGRGGYNSSDKKEVSGQVNPYRSNTAVGLAVYQRDAFFNATQSFSDDVVQVEDWMDQNAEPVLIGRNTGTLVKGE